MEMVMEKNINRILTYNKSAKETWQIFFYIYNKKNMKQLSLILLISTFSFCQTNFQFDYHLEYEFIHHVDSTKSEKKIYLTNSNDNSYNLEITNKDSLTYKLFFLKQDHIKSHINILKKTFQSNINININCKDIFPGTNSNKYQVENYEYIKTHDSLNIEEYKMVCLKPEKYNKKKKIGYYKLKFDKNLPVHLPNFQFDKLYEKWKKDKNLPNNFVLECSYYDYKGNLIWTEKLINYSKINKQITIITTECGEFYLTEILKLKQ